MSTEIVEYNAETGGDISIRREPSVVLFEAQKAAKALKDVVSQKAKPVILNGEQYLEYEDLQVLGRFYGVTAKVVSSEFLEYGTVQGFLARAVALRADGMEISAAEAMCMNDEKNWKDKPLFQLRSMAQTRACAKALRNVLAWVVVLAGYKPTPAEEMQDVKPISRPELKAPQQKHETHIKNPDAMASDKQIGAIQALMKKCYGNTISEQEKHEQATMMLEKKTVINSFRDLTMGEASNLIKMLTQESENA